VSVVARMLKCLTCHRRRDPRHTRRALHRDIRKHCPPVVVAAGGRSVGRSADKHTCTHRRRAMFREFVAVGCFLEEFSAVQIALYNPSAGRISRGRCRVERRSESGAKRQERRSSGLRSVTHFVGLDRIALVRRSSRPPSARTPPCRSVGASADDTIEFQIPR
jgi:hypothetical protein